MSRLLADVAKYCKKHELNDEKMSTLLGIYCYTHLYSKSLDILSYEEIYDFFKELIIHHSVLVRYSDTIKFCVNLRPYIYIYVNTTNYLKFNNHHVFHTIILFF